MDEQTSEALADVAATIDGVAGLLIDLSERLHGRLEQDEAEAADETEEAEDAWFVEREMRRELQRLLWVTEGTDPKPVPPRRRPRN